MILVDNSGVVDLQGQGDEIMLQGFLAAVSACRVYARGRGITLEQALSIMTNFIRRDGLFAATAGTVSSEVEVEKAGTEDD